MSVEMDNALRFITRLLPSDPCYNEPPQYLKEVAKEANDSHSQLISGLRKMKALCP